MKAARRLFPDKVPRWNEYVKTIINTREPILLDLKDWLRDPCRCGFYSIRSEQQFFYQQEPETQAKHPGLRVTKPMRNEELSLQQHHSQRPKHRNLTLERLLLHQL